MMMRTVTRVFSGCSVTASTTIPTCARTNLRQRSTKPESPDPNRRSIDRGLPQPAGLFEHGFLAQQIGQSSCRRTRSLVRDEALLMRTTKGQRVRCALPPHRRRSGPTRCFGPDSMIGIPGLLTAYRGGHITIANANRPGVADDKSISPTSPR